ncbi:MAG: response regulator [Chitinophagaceae bacterium]
MERKKLTSSVARRLRVVFSISVTLLVLSSLASFYSNRKLIESSQWVNHTNQVIVNTERLFSNLKDAEAAQRGYLLTEEKRYLDAYNGRYDKILGQWRDLKSLTSDNEVQQRNLDRLRLLIDERFKQMQKVISMVTDAHVSIADIGQTAKNDINRGNEIMEELRGQLNAVREEEKQKLDERLSTQDRYTTFTPVMVVLAAVLSVLISLMAYFRIKNDLEERMQRQREEEAKFIETKKRIAAIESVTSHIAEGDYSVRSSDESGDELGRISVALNNMICALDNSFRELKDKDWLQSGTVKLADAMRGERILESVAGRVLNTLASLLQAPVGAAYVLDKNMRYRLRAGFAQSDMPEEITSGAGLAGQAIADKKMLVTGPLPSGYLQIASSLGNTHATYIVALPVIFEDNVLAVFELGMLREPDALSLQLLQLNAHNIGIAVNAALSYERLQELLEETQAQAEELLAQHNELENINAELEAQTEKLQASEEELKVQQEELNEANLELEARAHLLEERNQTILERNREVVKKAAELEQSTKYKSEFLANMSHELRTPLNSILLLSRLLTENADGSLNANQVEYARVIQSSGAGLLTLIDEILDLSKIEAGKMDLEVVPVSLEGIGRDMSSLFAPVARDKGLSFDIIMGEQLPSTVETDKLRLEQILRNLIANALKFTQKGSVTLKIAPAPKGNIAFYVIDTGIGIPEEKQRMIFEAFQQADGSTRRKFGGTGLGLSISKELSRLLGGDIQLDSKPQEGSTFILIIPVSYRPYQDITSSMSESSMAPVPAKRRTAETETVNRYLSESIPERIPDDRDELKPSDRSILIVEDDVSFAQALLAFTRNKGYKGVVCVRGDEALNMAREYQPKGILLDIQLPVKSGFQVMEELKEDPLVRHIPVHVMSSHSLRRETLIKGAVDFIDKPLATEQMQEMFRRIEEVLNRDHRKVLIVEDNKMHAQALAYFLESFSIQSEIKNNVSDSIDALRSEADCVILDMGIPDNTAYETLETLKNNPEFEGLPIIVFTGKSLSLAEEQRIKRYADSIVVKTAHSYQRILDEVSIFLHLVSEQQGGGDKQSARRLGSLNDVLKDKTVLVVDDDVRNIFSLTKSLEQMEMTVVSAIDGKEALAQLQRNKKIDVVLLDMMMPQMDGYETAREIRKRPDWKHLPVIAVTAKAMTGDREKCISAGASDYITKPVDVDQLLSLLRVWLYDYGTYKRS